MSKQSEFEEKAETEETAGAIDEIAAIMEENNPLFQPGASIQSVVAHQSFENIEKAIKYSSIARLIGKYTHSKKQVRHYKAAISAIQSEINKELQETDPSMSG